MTPRPDDRPTRRRSGTDEELIGALRRLDGRTYGSYKSLIGDWDYGDFSLHIDHVQADPYAPPSAVRISASPQRMGLPAEALASTDARIACADFLARIFAEGITQFHSGATLRIAKAEQEILQRSSAIVTTDRVEIRFHVQLPARGRTIMGHAGAQIFDEDIPDLALHVFDFVSDSAPVTLKRQALIGHIHTYLDYRALQEALVKYQWVAFVADGSILARRSGISQEPLEDAVPFTSPESLRATVTLPYAGEVTGMALPPGVTVIVGGGYHGKSTLLSAIQRGVYPHIPGDGRERVATVSAAMKVRAADGRSVTGVDVSPFISHLPTGADTTRFSTPNASGSTSQAAAIVEAIDLGCPLLLLDEDTSATNLLIRDSRMRQLVAAQREPITPLVDRVRSLATERSISTIMVMGGSGDYLDCADRILMLDHYRCVDVTDQAREVTKLLTRPLLDLPAPTPAAPRIPVRSRGGTRQKTKAVGVDTVLLDKHTVDLSDIEQIVDSGQTEAIAWAMRLVLEHYADARTPLPQLLDRLERAFASEGLDTLVKAGARSHSGSLVRPRRIDIGAAVNRYRALSLS